MTESRAPDVTSRIMSAVKNKDGEAEMLLRRVLHGRGLRYRLHDGTLIGRPDIVFPGRRSVVFVDGDFWHGNAWRLRGMASFDEQFRFHSRPEFWRAKITRNVERDREVNARLAEMGWRVLRLWESDVLKDVNACADQVAIFLHGYPNAGETTPFCHAD
ncbi:MAG: very short patch repair endonuclease [Ktedonobacterales bacterium]|nr:very short patch repair endonuclease [Ktedonobacterales bacterium]